MKLITPRDHKSQGNEYGWHVRTSGAIYPGDPAFSVTSSIQSLFYFKKIIPSSITHASPKSSNFNEVRSLKSRQSNKKFSG